MEDQDRQPLELEPEIIVLGVVFGLALVAAITLFG